MILNKARKSKKEALLEELDKEDFQILILAYLYAKNRKTFGEDVTEKWETALQNADALEKAYRKGYHDALQDIKEDKDEK